METVDYEAREKYADLFYWYRLQAAKENGNASAKLYINALDFEGAYERYINTTKNWKKHWFNTCYTIAKEIPKWTKQFIFDSVNFIITKISDCIKKTIPKNNCSSYTYLIYMKSKGQNIFTKIGKTKDVSRRMNEFRRYYYRREDIQIDDVEVVKTYELPDDNLAQVLETLMHKYFSKSHDLIPNDRYSYFVPTEKDLSEFERTFNNVLQFA